MTFGLRHPYQEHPTNFVRSASDATSPTLAALNVKRWTLISGNPEAEG